MQLSVKTPKGGRVRFRVSQDADGFRSLTIAGETGRHEVAIPEAFGGWERARGHALGFLSDEAYGFQGGAASVAAAEVVSRLEVLHDEHGAALLKFVTTESTGFVRVYARRDGASPWRKVGSTGAEKLRYRPDSEPRVWRSVRKTLPLYARRALAAAGPLLDAAAHAGRAAKLDRQRRR